jgi:16S rRNA processing protein RimM
MIEKSNCLQIGTITKTHGIGGELAIVLSDGVFVDNIDAEFLFLDLDGGLVPFEIDTMRDKSDNAILVKFKLFENEKQVQRYKDCAVWMLTDDVAQSDENNGVPLLVGYSVVDANHGLIGVIADMIDLERNPLFVVNGKKGEILIPIADAFIVKIDDDKKEVHLDMPEGLIDLNI